MTDTLLEFPCRFPIKAFGEKDTDFENTVFELVKRHVAELEREHLSLKVSSNGSYISVTATITAQSKAQLDAIYQDLTDHEAVVMSL